MERSLEEAAFHAFEGLELDPISWISSKDEICRRPDFFKKQPNTHMKRQEITVSLSFLSSIQQFYSGK